MSTDSITPERIFCSMFSELTAEGAKAQLPSLDWTSGESGQGFPEIHGRVLSADSDGARELVAERWGEFLGLERLPVYLDVKDEDLFEADRHPSWYTRGDVYIPICVHVGGCVTCDAVAGHRETGQERARRHGLTED